LKIFISIIILLFLFIHLYSQDTIVLKEITVIDNFSNNINTYVIDSIKQKHHEFKSLGTLLSSEPGIILKNQGLGGIQTLSLMGTQNQHNQVFWFGMPLNSSLNGQIDYSLLNTNNNNYCHILYGAGSLQLNNGALGGIIEIKPRFYHYEKSKTTIQLQYESLNNKNFQIGHHFTYKKWTSNNQLMYSNGENKFFFKNIALLPIQIHLHQAPFQKASFQTQNTLEFKRLNISIMQQIYKVDRNIPPLMTTYFKAEHNESTFDEGIRTVFNSQFTINKWNIEGIIGYVYSNQEYKLLHEINNNTVTSYNSSSKENNSFFAIKLSNFSQKHIHYLTNVTFKIENGRFEDIKNKIGFCVQRYQLQYNQAIQINWLHSLKQKILLNTILYENKIYLLPSIINSYRLNSFIEIVYATAINHHIPSLNDLYFTPGGNPNLLTEKAWQNDISLKIEKKSTLHTFSFSIKPFYNHIQNWILWTPTQFGYWEANNIRMVNLYGSIFETNYAAGLNKNIKYNIQLNYTLQQAQGNDNNYKIAHNPYIPIHNINGFATFSIKKATIFIESQFSSTRYSMTYTDEFSLPPLTLINVGASYRFLSRTPIEISFSINNITNKPYQSIIWRPMPGRYFEIKLNCTL